MKRLRIEHTTGFDYPGNVGASYNEARMLPTTSDSQFVLSSQLDIEPSTAVNYYVDYFGTMRHYIAPGNDQSGDAKPHESIADLYRRPRVWMEGFHSSGWGQTPEE